MGRATQSRIRLAVDVPGALRRRVRVAAARRDLSLQEYVQRALERQLDEDAADALKATDDPVLAELWSHPGDDVFDQL